jgi:cyclic-di-GMP phosphodiesterase TipF (flagellum assembly factor)
LASVAGESLTEPAFLDTALAQAGSDGSMGLVLSFAQSAVRAFAPAHTRALAALAEAGFRFALEEVADLDMDFGALKGMGFDFITLDAPSFLEGLPAAGGRMAPADISRTLATLGMKLIVAQINDEWLLARILGVDVPYGKGAHFGGPKLVKADVVAAPAAA